VIRRVAPGLLFPAVLLVVYLAAPFLAGIGQVIGADWRGADVPTLVDATVVSLASATIATLLVALGGIPLGYALARIDGGAMRIVGVFVQLPLALPPLASGVLLLFLLGAYSPLGHVLGDVTDSFTGIVVAEAFVAAPFLIIAARAAFEAVDPVLEDVAATLGHGPTARFFRVTLPLAWPVVASGMLMCWLRAFGEFGATVLVA
jgi:molybdate transport system permease protein